MLTILILKVLKKNSTPFRVTNIYILIFTYRQIDIYLRAMYNWQQNSWIMDFYLWKNDI